MKLGKLEEEEAEDEEKEEEDEESPLVVAQALLRFWSSATSMLRSVLVATESAALLTSS